MQSPHPVYTLILIPLVILQLGAVKPLYLCIVNKVLITLAVLQMTGFSWMLISKLVFFLLTNVAASALLLLIEQTLRNA